MVDNLEDTSGGCGAEDLCGCLPPSAVCATGGDERANVDDRNTPGTRRRDHSQQQLLCITTVMHLQLYTVEGFDVDQPAGGVAAPLAACCGCCSALLLAGGSPAVHSGSQI